VDVARRVACVDLAGGYVADDDGATADPAPSPMVTNGRTQALMPMRTLLPMVTSPPMTVPGASSQSSPTCGVVADVAVLHHPRPGADGGGAVEAGVDADERRDRRGRVNVGACLGVPCS
jgi:hypothetical protein